MAARRAQEAFFIATWRWIDTFTRQLELCGVVSDDEVVITTTATTPSATVDALDAACQRLGARPLRVVVDSTWRPGDSAALAALFDAADLLVDCSLGQLGLAITNRLVEGGGRLLALATTDPDELASTAPHPGLHRRVDRADEILSTAAELRVRSDAGNDLRVDLSGARRHRDRGSVTDDQPSACWPGGSLQVVPAEGAVRGELVLMPGDLLVDFARFVRSPLRLRIEKDHVCEIVGDSTDADLLRSHLEALASPAAYGIAAVGIGLLAPHQGAGAVFDERLLEAGGPYRGGVVQVATGANEAAGRDAPGGVRFCLRGCTVSADGTELVADGELEASLAPDAYERAARG